MSSAINEIRPLSGKATASATQEYCRQYSGLKNWATWPKSQWQGSRLGFGSYRVHYSQTQHVTALLQALQNGINVIDTSSNYGDGGAEVLIGQVLKDLVEPSEAHFTKFQREQFVIVSKVGYIQGQNRDIVEERLNKGEPYLDVVNFDSSCWHCIHPTFIEDQLTLSLERLGLETIDVYLLHNPEYFLKHIKNTGELTQEAAQKVYYQRLEMAFEHLEFEVARGRIQSYGISSNTFGVSADSFDFTSLEKVIDICIRNGWKNFTTIQLPLNLFELGGLLEKNQTRSQEVCIELAAKNKIAVLLNRPLNAFVDQRLVRLASFENPEISIEASQINQLINELIYSEVELEQSLAKCNLSEWGRLSAYLRWGQELKEIIHLFHGVDHWETLLHEQIIPACNQAFKQLTEKSLPDDAKMSIHRYGTLLQEFTDHVSLYYKSRSAGRSRWISSQLKNEIVFSDSTQALSTLSAQALYFYSNLKNVTCVLVGMRHEHYVSECLKVMQYDDLLEQPQNILALNEKLKLIPYQF